MKIINGLFLVSLAFAGMAYAETYRVVTEEYPPYEYLENGKAAGGDVEILQAAAKLAGIELKIEFVPWARADNDVKTGAADAIFSQMMTDDRKSYMQFPSVPLSFEKNVIFANSTFIGNPTKLTDLNGQRVGVTVEYSYTDLVREEAPNNDTLMKKLSGERYGLAITNEAVGKFIVKTLDLKKIRVLPIDSGTVPLTIGFSKATPKGKAFFDKMEASLVAMQKSGEIDRIRKKYY